MNTYFPLTSPQNRHEMYFNNTFIEFSVKIFPKG